MAKGLNRHCKSHHNDLDVVQNTKLQYLALEPIMHSW